MNVTGSFVKCVNLKICINLIWPAVFEVYCQMAGRVQIKYQALSGAHPSISKNFIEMPKIDDFWHYVQQYRQKAKHVIRM